MEKVTLQLDGAQATFTTWGAIALSWTVPSADGPVEILDGYQTDEELAEGIAYRNAIMAPWSNRIKDSRYTWNGVEYDRGPDKDGVREALHGMVAHHDFTVAEKSDTHVVFASQVEDEGYPVPLKVCVRYDLGRSGSRWELAVRIDCQNLGEQDCPIGIGWHPYIRHDGPRENAELIMPARTKIVNDAALIPVAGADAFVPDEVDADGKVHLRGLVGYDNAWTDLVLTPSEVAEYTAQLHHASGARTEVTGSLPVEPAAGVGVMLAYTGDELPIRPGYSVAIEPCMFMTDAFNRPECREQLRVEPGATRTMTGKIVHELAR